MRTTKEQERLRMNGSLTMEQRFWDKVKKTRGCWIWLGSRRCGGYGELWDKRIGKTRPAHYISHELHKGPVPKGLTIHHTCKNPPCVNPKHLQVMTMRENILINDSPVGKNSRKTHCPKGHPYSPENTFHYKKMHRQCRTCKRDRDNERSRRNKSTESWRKSAGKD